MSIIKRCSFRLTNESINYCIESCGKCAKSAIKLSIAFGEKIEKHVRLTCKRNFSCNTKLISFETFLTYY